MAKLYFNFGPMNSSKTATLIMNHFNYREQCQNPVILKPTMDARDGSEPLVKCRAGLSASAILFNPTDNLFNIAAQLAGAEDRHFDVRVANAMKAMHVENPPSEHDPGLATLLFDVFSLSARYSLRFCSSVSF